MTTPTPTPTPTSTTTPPLPPYISRSPCGFHTTDHTAFTTTHPLPLSTDPDRLGFASPDVLPRLLSLLPGDAAGRAMAQLMIFNKTHARDRICPSCRRVYRVGEAARPWVGTFEEWLARPSCGVGEDYVEEQGLSGICSRMCFKLLTKIEAEEWSAERVDEWANRKVRALVGISPDVELEGWRVRKTTVGEQAVGGVKIVWERMGGGGGGGGLVVGGRVRRHCFAGRGLAGLGLGAGGSCFPCDSFYGNRPDGWDGDFFAGLIRSR